MSTTIDQKVVEMRFDNKQFESNVSTTMSTLEKLKKSLNLSGASKGLEDVNTAARKVDMSGLGKGVEVVQAKFSALQVMAVTALANITNSAVNAGKRMVSALTIDPIKTGFQEYETQINAVQTILANTSHNGTTIDQVNEALETLNKYADKTIYNFTEMTRNIGTFTAAGVDLQTSVDSIQGIANLAALSGSTSQQASTAMYQLSQALAAGRVSLMDWNSVVNAGMGGKVFQDALVRTSELLGTGAQAAIDMYGSFRESLTKGEWLTTEVLTETLKQFSGAYTEADLIAQGFTESQAKEIMSLAKTAEDAATKVKTFTQLWDVLKESAQSGWSQTWKLIVGDFEEAKGLLTPLADFLTGVINGISDARNALVESALGKSFTSLAEKITNVTKPINKTIDTIKDLGTIVDKVIVGDFGNGIDRLNALTEAGHNYYEVQNKVNEKLGDSFRYTQEQIDAQNKLLGVQTKTNEETSETADQTSEATKETVKLTDADKRLLKELTALSDEQLRSKGYTDEQIAAIAELREQAEKLGIPLKDFIDNLDEINGRWLLINSFKNIGQGLISVITAIKDAWRDVFPATTADQLFNVIAGLHKFSTYLVVSEETADKVRRTFEGMFAILDIVLTVVAGPLKIAFKLFTQLLSAMDTDILGFTANIGDTIVKFRDWIDATLDFTKIFEQIVPVVQGAIDSFKDWIETLKQSDNLPKDIAEGVIAGLGKAWEYIKTFFSDFKDSVVNGFEGIPNDMISGFVDGIWNGIQTVGQTLIELGKIILEKIKGVLGIHSPSTEFREIGENVIEGFIQGIQNGASAIWDVLRGIGEKCIEIFNSIDFGAVLTAGLGIGSLVVVNKFTDVLDKFASPFENLGEMLGSIGSFFEDLGDGLKSTLKASAMEKRSKAILNMAIAIGILAASVALLTQLDTEGKLLGAVATIGALAAVVGAMYWLVGKYGDVGSTVKISGFALAMVGIAAALLLVTTAVKRLGKIDPSSLKNGVTAIALLGAMMVGLVASTKLFNKDASKIGGTLLKMSAALLLMVVIIKLVSGMSAGEIAKGLIVITAFGGIMVGLTAITKLFSPVAMFKLGSTLLAMSTSMLLMVGVIKLVSGMSAGEIAKGLIVITAFGGILVGLTTMTKLFNPVAIFKLGSTLLAMSASMLLMAMVVKLASSMDMAGIVKGVLVVALFEGLLAGLVAMTRLATDKDLAKVGTTILAMSVSIGIMAATAALLGLVKTEHLAKGLIAVGLLTAMMVTLVKSTATIQKGKGTLIGLSIAIGALAASVAVLSFIDPKKLAASTAAISVIIGMFALLVKSTQSLAGVKIGPLVTMIAALAVLAGIVAALSFLNVEAALDASAAISMLMLSMSASLLLISKTGPMANSAIISLALMGLVVAELAIILGLMSHFDVNPSIETAKSLSILLLSMSAALVVLGVVGAMGPAAFIGIGALATLIAGIGGLIVGIGALMDKFPKLEEFLNKGIPVLEKIGYALGSFFGNIIGGFIGNLTSGIPEMGTHLSDFMTNLQPFLDGAKNIDTKIVDSVKALAETILILTGVDVINGLTSWFTGGSSMTDFSSQLVPFGQAMAEFSAVVKDKIDEKSVTAAANAGKMLAEMAAIIPNEGGIVSLFAGENNLTDFAAQLVPFGEAIAAFSSTVSGKINEGAVEAAANAGKVMAEMAATIPNTGGVAAFFTGDNDMVTFGSQLVLFGGAIVEFSRTVSGNIDAVAVETAANAGKVMAEMAAMIPNTGGVIAFFTGDNDMVTFGSQLAPFGEALVGFSDTVSGNIDAEAITAAANAGKVIAEMAAMIPNTGGVIAFFTGDNDLSTFGTNLASFGEGFAAYSEKIKNIDTAVVTATVNAAKSLVELQNGLGDDDGLFSDKQTLKDFGKTLSKFGGYLSDYYDSISDIDTTLLSSVISQVNRLVSMAKGMVGLDTSGMSSFSTALSKLGEAGIDGFIKAFDDADTRISQAASKMLTTFINAANSKKTSLNTAFTTLIQGALTSITGKQQAFYNAGESLMTRFGAGFMSRVESITNMLQQFMASSLNTIAGYGENFFTTGAGLMDRFVIGADSKKVKLSNLFVTTVNDALVSIKSRYKAFYQAGGYLVTGFADGIKANTYKAEAQAAAMARAAELAAKEELDINSPSKVMEEEVGEMIGEGIAKGIENTIPKVRQSAEDMADEILDASESAFDEKVFEENIGAKVGSGVANGIFKSSEQAAKAAEQMMKKVATNASVSWVENRQDELGIIEELAAWKRVQMSHDYGTEERAKAVEEIKKLRDELSAANEEYYNGVLEVQKETTEKRKELEEEYYLKVKEIDDKLAEDIDNLNKAYEDAIESRRESIYSAYSLFDEITSENVSGSTLINNLQGQVDALDNWVNNINSLSKRGIDTGLLEELREMGPSAADQIKALNAMSAEELDKYVDLWKQKHELAKEQATLELEDMRVDTLKQIETLRSNVEIELDEYTATWKEKMDSLLVESNGKLGELRSSWLEKVVGLKTDTTSEFSQMANEILDILGNSSNWSESGANIIEGVLQGVVDNSTRLTTNIENVMTSALDAAKKVLGIHSPSKEFAEIGRYSVEGFVKGLSTFSSDVSESAANIGQVAIETLNSSLNGLGGLNEAFYNLGKTLIINMLNGVNSQTEDITEAFMIVLESSLTGIRSRYSKFYSAGAYLVQGFANGITANTYKAVARAKAMARAAAEAAAEELDEHSPSKVGYGIGNFFGLGFVNGIGANVAKSYSAGSSIAEAAKTGLSNAIAKVSDLIENGIDSEPTIRPVLDLSGVESEATRLNAMFSRTQAMSISSNMAHKSSSEIQNGEQTTPTTGNTYTFTQNNYSPKALSRLEIYRQTKNQFSAMKGLVET